MAVFSKLRGRSRAHTQTAHTYIQHIHAYKITYKKNKEEEKNKKEEEDEKNKKVEKRKKKE